MTGSVSPLMLVEPSHGDPAPKRPFLKFFPSDWRGDERLGMCSLGARGLLMELVCLMNVADPYGYLVVNGTGPTDRELTRLVRATNVGEMRRLRDELLNRGVLSKAADGTIYSRRMVREAQRGKVNAVNGRKGAGARWGGRRTAAADSEVDGKHDGEVDGKLDGEQTAAGDGKSDGPIFQIPDSRSPQPPRGQIADPAVDERAGRFLERYPETYARCRNGASYRVNRLKQERDLEYARELVLGWPDDDRLVAMLEVFLRRSDIGEKNKPGTPGQFLHMAPDCDRLLKEHGR